jgi:hypothetical protein
MKKKTRLGAPVKPASERKSYVLRIRFKAAEMKALRACADAAGMDISKFVRLKVLGEK